jgi:hypothetical protein
LKMMLMKPTIRISAFFIIIFITCSCSADKKLAGSKVSPLSESTIPAEGSIVYGLPRSVFTVVAELERTLELPGPYARYAGDLLGLDNVIQSEKESWAITGISLNTHEELDPSELYVIESSTVVQTNVLSLKKEGLILDINPAMYYSGGNLTGIDKSGSDQFLSFDLGSDEYFQLQRDTAYKRVTVDSSFIRIPYIVEKKRKLPVDQLAEKAAKRLMEMRDGKHLILSGESTVFPQNEAAINEMNRLEKEYTELFAGKTIREKRRFTCQVIPSKEMTGKPVVLFRLSEVMGPLNGNDPQGKQITIEFIPEQKAKDLMIINKSQPQSGAPVYDKLFYRVPDVVNLKISMGSEILFSSRRLVYQFGQVIKLPANYIIGK